MTTAGVSFSVRHIRNFQDEYDIPILANPPLAQILRDEPFPWQMRLCADFLAGDVPSALDIPTGLGKTKVIAAWLAALAAGAPLPRRLVYVVDRRAVVDQASEEAANIAVAYREVTGGDIAISTLRGGSTDSPDWREDPARPAIIVGTVDMIGSRLLFEGYGVPPRARAMHAGLLGLDTLIVLDEAHLVPTFRALIETIATEGALMGKTTPPAPPLRVMAMSATQPRNAGAPPPFRLNEDDRGRPDIRQRLEARKSLTIVPAEARRPEDGRETVDTAALAMAMAGEALRLSDSIGGPTRIVIYCDSRDVAEKIDRQLAGPDRKTILFTGARRVHEREQAAAELREAGFIDGQAQAHATVFLVATSAGEVGVDLDADHAVMDLVPWERLVQRLGRVNRRGRGSAIVRVIDPGLMTSPSGASLAAVRQLLGRLPARDAAVQVGPGALAELASRAPELVLEASSPAPLRPALTLPLVEAWALTGLREHTGRPEVAPWLRGWVDERPQTRIVWRTHLPRRDAGQAEVRDAEIEAFFENAVPHLSEGLETETHRIRDWLYARAKGVGESATGAKLEKQNVALLLDPDGGLRMRVTLDALARWAGRKLDRREQRERQRFEDLLAGRTLVVDAALGGLAETGLMDDKLSEPALAADGEETWEVGFSIRVGRAGAEDESAGAAHRFVTRFSGDGEPEEWLDIGLTKPEDTDEDASSRSTRDVPLAEHEGAVEAEVRRIAARLGLEVRWVELLATAARLHDHGKRADVWQNAMNAPRAGRPYAKTRRGDGHKLMGYRHEFGSLFSAARDPAVQAMDEGDRDLLLHLIAAHHGNARPLIGVENCPEGPPSAMAAVGLEVALRFARLQKRWGPWGLAWWESLLRAADQAVSKGGG